MYTCRSIRLLIKAKCINFVSQHSKNNGHFTLLPTATAYDESIYQISQVCMCVLYRTLYTLPIINLYLSLLSLYCRVLFLCTNKTVFKVFQQRHSSFMDFSLPPKHVCGSIDTTNVSRLHLQYLYTTLIAQ